MKNARIIPSDAPIPHAKKSRLRGEEWLLQTQIPMQEAILNNALTLRQEMSVTKQPVIQLASVRIVSYPSDLSFSLQRDNFDAIR